MKFFKLLDDLKEQYKKDYIVRKNGTILLGPGKIPRSRHMLYRPLDDAIIDEYLVSQYKKKFPEDYIRFLKYSNGADLYNVKLNTKKFSFAHGMLTIFGLPRTAPYSRPMDMEEPFDVRVQDLSRHDDVPDTWLKCGTKHYDFHTYADIFIDTETNRVFACVTRQKDIIDQWDNLDDCFCSIFESVKDCKLEYDADY